MFPRGFEAQDGFGQGDMVGEGHLKQWEQPEQKPRGWKVGVCPGSSMQFHLALEEVKAGKNCGE